MLRCRHSFQRGTCESATASSSSFARASACAAAHAELLRAATRRCKHALPCVHTLHACVRTQMRACKPPIPPVSPPFRGTRAEGRAARQPTVLRRVSHCGQRRGHAASWGRGMAWRGMAGAPSAPSSSEERLRACSTCRVLTVLLTGYSPRSAYVNAVSADGVTKVLKKVVQGYSVG